MEVAGTIIGVIALLFAVAVFMSLMSIRDDLERKISDLRSDNWALKQNMLSLESSVDIKEIAEGVPVRDKCPCGHHAFTHNHRGCQQAIWFGKASCACKADRDSVMFTPNPMKQLS